MRVITINVNGIRSASKKGLHEWLQTQSADIICLQEVRASRDQIEKSEFNLDGYHMHNIEAEKKGYSGVAILCKHQPINIEHGLGFELCDTEGRHIALEFDKFKVSSTYFPSGTSGEQRQEQKMIFLDKFESYLLESKKLGKPQIFCGDYNIAHTKMDIKNWKTNQKNSGFLPCEREWFDKIFQQYGFVDSYRYHNPEKIEYTWWSNRANAYANNVGWRLDYQIISPDLKKSINTTEIYRDNKFSDHAPYIVEYDF